MDSDVVYSLVARLNGIGSGDWKKVLDSKSANTSLSSFVLGFTYPVFSQALNCFSTCILCMVAQNLGGNVHRITNFFALPCVDVFVIQSSL